MIAALNLKAMNSSIKSVVKYKIETSDVIQSFHGVKQWDASSSLLFMMYVNDIAENIDVNIDGIFTLNELKLFLLLYADDQALLATSAQSLQHMLNDVETYCNKWELKINTNKTKLLIFEKSNRPTQICFFIYGTTLELVTHFK